MISNILLERGEDKGSKDRVNFAAGGRGKVQNQILNWTIILVKRLAQGLEFPGGHWGVVIVIIWLVRDGPEFCREGGKASILFVRECKFCVMILCIGKGAHG